MYVCVVLHAHVVVFWCLAKCYVRVIIILLIPFVLYYYELFLAVFFVFHLNVKF